MIYVRDVIKTIVESIQSTGSVTSFVDNTGSYTITTSSTGNLEEDFKVVLIYADTSLNRDVIITAKTDTTFTFSGTGITEPVSWKMALYFEVGHRIELNKLYTNKAKSTNKLVQEYPLFWLYTDFQKNKGDGEYTSFETTLQAAIADFSVRNKYEADRITDKFKPVLYPYYELIETAFNTGTNKRNFVTTFGEDSTIKFEPIDRPFFGSADETKNVLPQPTDAIELEVDLKWMIEKCITSTTYETSDILTATSYQTSLAEVGIEMSFTDPLKSINFGDDLPNVSIVTDVEKTYDYSYLGRYDINVISANVDVTKLVFDNSQLTALNIAKLINLTYLDLDTNSLPGISIAQFPELIYLSLLSNNILSANIDTILSLLDGFGKSNGTLLIATGNDSNTEDSNDNIINLESKGWTVDVSLIPVASNLILKYDGTLVGETLTDLSGSGNDGKITVNTIFDPLFNTIDWWKPAAAGPILSLSNTQVHSGTASMKMDAAVNEIAISGDFETITGKTYNYSIWCYRESGGGNLGVQIKKGGATTYNVNTSFALITGTWVNITGSYVEIDGGVGALLRFYSKTSGKVVYIDDLSISSSDLDNYIQLPNNTDISDLDISQTFYSNDLPKSIIVTNTGYFDNSFLYNLNNLHFLVYSGAKYGNDLLAAHDYIDYNPITSIDNTISVKKDATGDFIDIQSAIDSVSDASASKKYKIDIYDDWIITDKADYQLNDVVYYHFLILKNYVYLNGVGSAKIKIQCSIPTNSSDAETTYYEPFNLDDLSGINNIEVSMRNGRYGMHSDSANVTFCYNSKIINYGNGTLVAYRVLNSLPAGDPFDGAALGTGFSSGQYHVFYNCEFVGKYPMQTHDGNNTTLAGIQNFMKCIFTSSGEYSSLSQAIGNTSVQSIVQFNSCSQNKEVQYIARVTYSGAPANLYYLLASVEVIISDGEYLDYQNITDTGGSLRITSEDANGSVNVIGGTAQALIMPTPDEIDNHSTGQMEVGEWSSNTALSLGSRLGDCSTINKTLILSVDAGLSQTVTFNQDFTAQTNVQVLAFIDLNINGAISTLYQRAEFYSPDIIN